MSIRPVDLQVILPHATDVGKVQAIQNDQAATSQQLFAEKLMREAQERQGQVQETQRSEMGKVTRDKEKDQQERKKKKKQQNVASEQKEKPEVKVNYKDRKGSLDPLIGKNLDIGG